MVVWSEELERIVSSRRSPEDKVNSEDSTQHFWVRDMEDRGIYDKITLPGNVGLHRGRILTQPKRSPPGFPAAVQRLVMTDTSQKESHKSNIRFKVVQQISMIGPRR